MRFCSILGIMEMHFVKIPDGQTDQEVDGTGMRPKEKKEKRYGGIYRRK